MAGTEPGLRRAGKRRRTKRKSGALPAFPDMPAVKKWLGISGAHRYNVYDVLRSSPGKTKCLMLLWLSW